MKHFFRAATTSNIIEAPNHGKPWTQESNMRLAKLWRDTDTDLRDIATDLGRTPSSTASQLKEIGLVGYCSVTHQYTSNRDPYTRPKAPSPSTPPEAPTMNSSAINIETKIFIGGIEAGDLSDADIFSRIARIEGEIDKLKAIRAKSKKRDAAVKKLEDDVAALVAYVDGR